MTNYEIMLIIDPKEDFSVVEKLANEVFEKPNLKKLERTVLAYEINKSQVGCYCLIETKASGDQIKEFTRKCNLSKKIWRTLIINIDKEVNMEKSIELIKKRREKLVKDYEERIKDKKPKIWNPYEPTRKNNQRNKNYE